jgi:hypothetical protein
VASVVKALGALDRGCRDVKTLLEGALDKAMTLVTAGFAMADAAAPLVATIVVDFKADADDDAAGGGGGGKGKKGKGGKGSGGSGGAAAAAEAPSDHASTLAKARAEAFKTAARDALQAVGASYTNGLLKCREEVNERLAFLKAVPKA